MYSFMYEENHKYYDFISLSMQILEQYSKFNIATYFATAACLQMS